MWDKLLSATGTVSKQLGSRFLDDAYNSDSDEEGVDTHVIKTLKSYYTSKGTGYPNWLGNESMPRTTGKVDYSRTADPVLSSQQSSVPSSRSTKVSLRGIYEQAAERNTASGSARRAVSKSANEHDNRVSEESAHSTRSVNSNIRNASGLTSGERFRENLKSRRALPRGDSSMEGFSEGQERAGGLSRYRHNPS